MPYALSQYQYNTPVASENSQQAKAEDKGDTHPLPPAHLEVPNDLLRQEQNGNIGDQLDTRRRHL